MSTHTLADWAEMVALAFGIWGTSSVFYFLLVDADLADFDPRPPARRVLAVAHQGVVHAGHDLNRVLAHAERAAVQAAITTAAALALLLPAAGGTR